MPRGCVVCGALVLAVGGGGGGGGCWWLVVGGWWLVVGWWLGSIGLGWAAVAVCSRVYGEAAGCSMDGSCRNHLTSCYDRNRRVVNSMHCTVFFRGVCGYESDTKRELSI